MDTFSYMYTYMYIINIKQNKVGSRTKLCDAPENTLQGDEKQPSTITCWKRSLKKGRNHVNR